MVQGVRSILLLPFVARCLETIDVCIWRVCFYVCCSDCVNVCCVAAVVKIVFFSLGVLKYVVCLCMGCDGCCVFCLYCEAWSCRCSCMGSVSVSSCICCMFVSCVHPVAVLNGCVLHNLQFGNAGRGCNRRPYRKGILQSRPHNCFIGSHEGLLLFTISCCSESVFMICRGLCALY